MKTQPPYHSLEKRVIVSLLPQISWDYENTKTFVVFTSHSLLLLFYSTPITPAMFYSKVTVSELSVLKFFTQFLWPKELSLGQFFKKLLMDVDFGIQTQSFKE